MIASSIIYPDNILLNNSIGIVEINESIVNGENENFYRLYFDEEIPISNNNDKLSSKFNLLSMDNFKYSYFIKNEPKNILSSYYKDNEYFIAMSKQISLSANATFDKNDPAVYYDKSINFNNVQSNFIQLNDKIYIINKNLFDIKNNVYIKNQFLFEENIPKNLNMFFNRDPNNKTVDFEINHKFIVKLIDKDENTYGIYISGSYNSVLVTQINYPDIKPVLSRKN